MGRRSRLRQQSFRRTPELDRLHRRDDDEAWPWCGEQEPIPAVDADDLTLWHQK